MSTPVLEIYPSAEELAFACAERIAAVAVRCIRERGAFTLVLSGGESPVDAYRMLGSRSLASRVDWSRVQLLFTDERTVPPSDAQSNYGMVQRELLSFIPLPAENVHRIIGEREPHTAASEYESTVKRVLEMTGGLADFVLLGLGEDGHTASLFPGTQVLKEEHALASAVFVSRLQTWRITLTLPVLNAAREVRFLVSGGKKSLIVKRVLTSPGLDMNLPATLVWRDAEPVRWMLDADAATMIPSSLRRTE